MKKIILFLIPVVLLFACEKREKPIQCGDYQVYIKLQDEILNATINGDNAVLNETIAASGARYSGTLNDTSIVLWGKGDNWTLTLGEDQPIECK